MGAFCHSAAEFLPCFLPVQFEICILASGMVSFGGAGACGCSLHAIALAEQQKKSLTLPKDLLHLEAAAADTILGGGRQLLGCIIGQKITIYFQLKVGIPVAFMPE